MNADPNRSIGSNPAQITDSKLPNGAPRIITLDADSAAYGSGTPRGRLWVHRLAVLAFVFFCAVLGVILVIFPWREEWTNNALVRSYPGAQDFLGSGFLRGVCSGLGLLDIWIGFWEAVHYRE